MVPAGALLYLEARDFGALMADWNRSTEKRVWLASANYQAFSRSTLFIKLGQAQTEFATAAGVPPDYALLGSVAGGNSALAIYNIGELEFLYVTRLASARALDTALWKSARQLPDAQRGRRELITSRKTWARIARRPSPTRAERCFAVRSRAISSRARWN